jgi:hypothetical protein
MTRPEGCKPSLEAQTRIDWLREKYGQFHPQVHDRLLAAGGDAAVMQPLGWFEVVFLARAVTSPGTARQQRGRQSECHRNASRHFRRDPARFRIVSGFALTWDHGVGCWHPHSWVWDSRKNEIIETTLSRDLYYGAELNDAEAERFAAHYD